jgi:uncharacterized protein YjbJ (UPF0337 family)
VNWNQIEAGWKDFAARVTTEWSKLTDDDLTSIAGKRPRMVAKVQEHYGSSKGDVERQINDWLKRMTAEAKAQEPPTSQ